MTEQPTTTEQKRKWTRFWLFRINQRLLVFAFFLFIATLFWFLNALSKDYTATLTYPVEYSNFPQDRVLVNQLPTTVDVKVTGYGFTLLRHRLRIANPSLHFDVSQMALVRRQNNGPMIFYFLTNQALPLVDKQLPSEVEVLEIAPDSLIFHFDQITSKLLRVRKQNLDFQFRQQFMQTGPLTIEPDTVRIWGPAVVIDTIEQVALKTTEFTDLHTNLNKTIPLMPIGETRLKPQEVTLSLPVEQFTEVDMKVPVLVNNLPRQTRLRMFPEQVHVIYRVGLSDYNKVTPSQLQVVVDFNDTKQNMSNKLPVEIVQYPDFAQQVRVNPEYIEYIIEK